MTPQPQGEVRRARRPLTLRFIDVDELIALWDELYLPDHVRRAWAAWLARHPGVQLSC